MLQTFITLMLAGRKDDEKGATAVEYGLLVALIAAMIVTVLLLLGPELVATFQKVVDAITTANAA